MPVNIIWASDLALKYDFVPRSASQYTSSFAEPINTVGTKTRTQLLRQVLSNVQVVAARDFKNKQPPYPTISYSYINTVKVLPKTVVIAAKNYTTRHVQLTDSNLDSDNVITYVIGTNYNQKGYSQQSKGALYKIQREIAANPLIGCAPLSVSCSRTATDKAKLGVERGPLSGADSGIDSIVETPGINARQQLKP
jgi:hypothetical protein